MKALINNDISSDGFLEEPLILSELFEAKKRTKSVCTFL
jgi:hypothetical protein